MGEELLKNVLNKKIATELLFKWLSESIVEDDRQRNLFTCSRGEFITFFLNYIHEATLAFDKSNESPQKVHTPKSIRKLNRFAPTETRPKRRSALFKPNKSDSNTSIVEETETGFVSPRPNVNSSPIYSNSPFGRSKNRNSGVERNICFGDFIKNGNSNGTVHNVQNSHLHSHSKKKKSSDHTESQDVRDQGKKLRRINPTNLNQRTSSPLETKNSFRFDTTNENEIYPTDFTDSRNLLIGERDKIKSVLTEGVKVPSVLGTEISVDFSSVTFRSQIELLSEVYAFCLNENYVLNVMSEVYFVISLVLTKQFNESTIDFTNFKISDREVSPHGIFNTLHNTVYFGYKTLQTQVRVLSVLDKFTIKLLCTNDRFKSLPSEFLKKLTSVYDRKIEVSSVQVEQTSHVCFMSDTDNRENFPTEASFHAFRKQRDMFYEILSVWEHSRFLDGWNFQHALGTKIKTLLSVHANSANYRHLARLFKLHLLSVCGKEEALAENELGFLSSIPNVTKEKLTRLKTRLVRKTNSNGINAAPNFPGQQEFYKDFILTASLHTLNVHLKDSFTSEIVSLNDTNFNGNELEEHEAAVDETTRKSYLTCVKSLRLLAKFLGLIESLPYQSFDEKMSDRIVTGEISNRYWEQPAFDLREILRNSVTNGNLILTIPWMTKYLAMLDYVTLRLPYYETLYDTLFEMFHSDPNVLLRLCLGWLFELPHFPSELYYIWCTKANRKTRRKPTGLDALDIIDTDVVYVCCPYLNEFKHLLRCNARNGSIGIKHITPVTANESPVVLTEKRIKLQLEEAFLNAQPNSIRRTVEFVSERVASATVKQICNRIVPDRKELALRTYRDELKHWYNGQSKLVLSRKTADFVKVQLNELARSCGQEIEKQTTVRIPDALKSLLSDDEPPPTIETCVAISTRLCCERTQQWIATHINANVFREFDSQSQKFLEELQRESEDVKEKPTFALPTMGKEIEHDPNAPSAINVVESLRDACLRSQRNSTVPKLTELDVLELFELAEKTLGTRCDVNECIGLLIHRLFTDLFVFLVANDVSTCTDTLITRFVEFYKTHGSGDVLKSVLCIRNVGILEDSTRKSWSKYAELIGRLLNARLLSCEDFETQCLGIYTQNWNANTLESLSRLFRDVVDMCSQNDTKFTILLNFLSNFCSYLELE